MCLSTGHHPFSCAGAWSATACFEVQASGRQLHDHGAIRTKVLRDVTNTKVWDSHLLEALMFTLFLHIVLDKHKYL